MLQQSNTGRSLLGQITQRASTTPSFMAQGLGASLATHVMVFGGYSLYLLCASWWTNPNLPEWMPPQSGVRSRPQADSQAIVIEAAFQEPSESEPAAVTLKTMAKMEPTPSLEAKDTTVDRRADMEAPPTGQREIVFPETMADPRLVAELSQRRSNEPDPPTQDQRPPRSATVPKRGHDVAVQTITSVASQAALESEGAETETLPQKIFSPPPEYPARSYADKVGGRAKIRVQLGSDGQVIATSVYASSGVDELDRAAIEAVGRWRFEPFSTAPTTLRVFVVPIRFIPPG